MYLVDLQYTYSSLCVCGIRIFYMREIQICGIREIQVCDIREIRICACTRAHSSASKASLFLLMW